MALVRSDLADAELARDRAVSDEHAARDQHLQLWERRLADIAGDLARQLIPGEACLVCGSCDHPAPASLAADHVGRAAVDQAAQVAQRAGTERQRAHERVATLHTRAGELAALTGGQDESAAAASLSAARARVADATAAVSNLERETALAALAVAQRDAATGRQQQLTEEASVADTSLTELGRQRSAIVADLDRLRGADADVLARQQRLEREAVAVESLLDALGTARVADRALAAAQRRLVAACARHGFPNEQEAAAAVLAPALVDDLSAAEQARDHSRAAQLAVLAEPELQGLEDLPEPQVELLRAEVTSADSELQRRRSEATLARDVVRRLAALARSVADHDDAAAPVRHEFDRVDQLTTCVLGTGADNQLRMRLSAYVLAARLEEVAAAATERLTAMSDGRYALVHSDERAKGGGRSGLGLRVVDAWTGVERETSTLSGGESFLASLALALGLADVVQAEAAGSPIETLFVDEGFGTLDEETLEEVMTVLDGLRDGGRAVGLVSHVLDLRARIPAQLEVQKTRAGSTLVQRDVGAGDCSGRES
jgi:exonuclease SbcC